MSPTKAIYVMTGIQKGGITNILSIENNQNSDFNKDVEKVIQKPKCEQRIKDNKQTNKGNVSTEKPTYAQIVTRSTLKNKTKSSNDK